MRSLVLNYGNGTLRVRVPEGLAPPGSILDASAPAPRSPTELYRTAVAELLEEFEEPVAIVVPDETRPAARGDALAALKPRLGALECAVVVGAGLHPAAALDAFCPCHVHDARAPDLVAMGEAAGIGVFLHPVVARSRTVVVVGAVMPHYLARVSGGPKGLVPGVAGEKTILEVHARADGGDFHAAIRACAALVPGRCFSINLLVGARGPFDATGGPLLDAHARAVARYEAACTRPRPEPADVVVADAGGHPADATLLQAHKAYDVADRIVKPRGTIILVAACDGGFGHPEFERRLRGGEGGFHPYARTAEEWRRKTRRTRTRMVTELDTRGLGVEKVDLFDAIDAIAPDARVLWARRAQDLLFA